MQRTEKVTGRYSCHLEHNLYQPTIGIIPWMEWRFARASKQRTRGTARGCSSRPKPPDEDTQLSGYGAQSSCRRQMPSGSLGEVTRSVTSRPLVLQDERPTSPSTHRGVVELPHTVDAHLKAGGNGGLFCCVFHHFQKPISLRDQRIGPKCCWQTCCKMSE